MPGINAQWQGWLASNLARGCDEASIIHAMVTAGWDPVEAGIALLQAMAPPGAGYRYGKARFPETGSVLRTHDRDVRIALRVGRPEVAVIDDFMSHDECDELVKLSRVKLQPSTIVDPHTGENTVIEDRRSHGTSFSLGENPLIACLDRRISAVMHWPVENGEGLQILNYQVGGEYRAHYDFFAPEDPGSAAQLVRGGQRVSTLVIYLNDVAAGGETVFPHVHLQVTPKKGAAVYFEYCNENGQLDPLSLHAGAPVQAGEKWIATKWMRQRPYK